MVQLSRRTTDQMVNVGGESMAKKWVPAQVTVGAVPVLV